MLWHYTRDFNRLKGILLGAEMWASALPYLNDTEEFRYGVREALDVLRDGLINSDQSRVLLSEVERRVLNSDLHNNIFSISFSTEEDDLSQWRAYSGSGPSFAIGFNPKKLEAHAARYGFSLHEVKYEKEDIALDASQELREGMSDINQAIDTGSGFSGFEYVHASSLLTTLARVAPRYKHPKFAAEKEWRLTRFMPVMRRKPHLARRFRQAGSLVVPYIAMPLPKPKEESKIYEDGEYIETPVAAIVIGPSPHRSELKLAVEDMTARSGFGVDVSSSEIPFRNW